MPLIRVGR